MPTRYVNTGSSPGGDGTTNATTGDNRAYSSLNAAEAALPADITTGGDQGVWTIICEGSTADTTAVTFVGTTTSATYYIEVKTEAEGRHDGKWNTAKYRIEVASGYAYAVTISEANVVLVGLQILRVNSVANYVGGVAIYAAGCGVMSCIVQASLSGSHNDIWGVYYSPSGLCYNNLLIGWKDGTTDDVAAVYSSAASIFNTTIVGCRWGVYNEYGSSAIIKNCLFLSCDIPASGTYVAGTDYNATDSSSIGYTVSGGGNTHDRLSQTFTFVDSDNDDYHLASDDSGARDYGVDLSANFTVDIDGSTRSGDWDIGADEYVSASNNGVLTVTADDATCAATGALALAGTLTATTADATPAGAGTLALSGALSVTTTDATLAATGTVAISGALSVTTEDATCSVTGTLAVVGVGTLTTEDVSCSATGTLAIAGTGSFTAADATCAATGTLTVTGSLSVTTEDATLEATGTISEPGTNTGTLSVTTDDATLAGVGTLAIAGQFAVTAADATCVVVGSIVISGSFDVVAANATCAARAVMRVRRAVSAQTITSLSLNSSQATATLSVPKTTLL